MVPGRGVEPTDGRQSETYVAPDTSAVQRKRRHTSGLPMEEKGISMHLNSRDAPFFHCNTQGLRHADENGGKGTRRQRSQDFLQRVTHTKTENSADLANYFPENERIIPRTLKNGGTRPPRPPPPCGGAPGNTSAAPFFLWSADMSRQNTKFLTDKFETRNKRKFLTHVTHLGFIRGKFPIFFLLVYPM